MTYALVVAFLISAAITLALASRRAFIVRFKADDCLHLADTDQNVIEQQRQDARRLKSVDAWGKPLTILTAVLGVASYVVWWIGV